MQIKGVGKKPNPSHNYFSLLFPNWSRTYFLLRLTRNTVKFRITALRTEWHQLKQKC